MNPLLVDTFKQQFQASPDLFVRAPGRVNIIGEHTDYNEGFVLPMAIDRTVQIALRPRIDQRVIIHSLEYGEETDFLLNDLQKGNGWVEYIKGAAWAMQENGWPLSGWEGVMTGNVPRGAGLSSSSAVAVAAILAFVAASDLTEHVELEPIRVALLAHRAEDGWVGVHGGIMDQMVSVLSRPGHVLFLDCRSLEYRHIPLPEGIAVAVLDTSTRRGLVDSAYNERRYQCDLAAEKLGVRALRDVSETDLQLRAALLDEVILRRARHVITENARVMQAIEAMQHNDPKTMGHLLDASHISLRNDFEVSNEALDAMVGIAQHQPGCYGARMTGAGFGGCAVALIKQEQGTEFSATVEKKYEQATGLIPHVYLCQPAKGANIECLTI